jgi:hypothetical protein
MQKASFWPDPPPFTRSELASFFIADLGCRELLGVALGLAVELLVLRAVA